MKGIPSGPSLGRILHHSEVKNGRSFVADVSRDGKAMTIHHNSGKNIDVKIGLPDTLDFAVPSVCGKAIVCYLQQGRELVLDTLTGQPWSGTSRLKLVI